MDKMEKRYPAWLRILLLVVLAYEGLGAVAGGILLITKPDGQLMDMPVQIMHGTFRDFFIPGLILLGLGLLGIWSFVSVLRRHSNDWFMAFLFLGGFYIWFTVEIIVLREVVWLHLMWAWPVLAGILAALPLAAARRSNIAGIYIACGWLSSLCYIVANLLVPLGYAGYDHATFTVSELSAIGSPTRWLWVVSATPWAVLFMAFGWGLWYSAGTNRRMTAMGWVVVAYCAFNFYWPPMHMRGAMPTLTDALHIVWASVTVLCMVTIMLLGGGLMGVTFRNYTWISIGLLILFGMLTGTEAPNVPLDAPTPMIGIWERINIGIFMLWVAVLSVELKKHQVTAVGNESRKALVT